MPSDTHGNSSLSSKPEKTHLCICNIYKNNSNHTLHHRELTVLSWSNQCETNQNKTRNVGQCPTWWQCSNAAKTQNPMKFTGVPQTRQQISAVSRPKFTIFSGHVEEVLVFNKFFFPIVDTCLSSKDIAQQSCAMMSSRSLKILSKQT